MTSTYEEITTTDGAVFIKRTDENGQESYIPTDPANSDYQRYLKRDEPQVKHLTENPIA
jgi:hypothetical protein